MPSSTCTFSIACCVCRSIISSGIRPGETMYQIAQIHRVRDFLTGKLLETFLDLITLCVLLPFLFYLNTILASIVLVCAAAITLIILAYLKPLRVLYGRVIHRRDLEVGGLGRDHRRHQDGQGAGLGAATPGALG